MKPADQMTEYSPPVKTEDHCAHCGYDISGLAGAVCPECGSYTGSAPPELAAVRSPKRFGRDAALTLACVFFALWLSCAACELSFRVWIDWLILWPVLIVLTVPVLAFGLVERPRVATAALFVAALWWVLIGHADVYANVLVHWVRSPGIPGSKGVEPDTIKSLFRYGGGGTLLLAASAAALGGDLRSAR